MTRGKHLLAAGICCLLFCHAIGAQSHPHLIRVVVQTSGGTRLPDVDVRVVGVGGKPTSDTGEFIFALPAEFESGSVIEFFVVGWNITNLDNSKTYIPKSETAIIHIKVSRIVSSKQNAFDGLRTKNDRTTGDFAIES